VSDEKFVIRQSSGQHTDGTKAKREDIEDAVTKNVDAIGFTELDAETKRLLKARCEELGFVISLYGSVGLAINPKHQIIEESVTKVLPALKADKGGYRARSILELTIYTPGGNCITLHESHWITDAANNPRRDDKRREQSEAMVERVTLHGRGNRLSFWLGDTNSDEQDGNRDEVQKTLTRGHLVSVFDALKKYPRTMGKKTIDVIGHFDADGHVQPEKVVVGKRRGSNHRKVTATYTIRKGATRG
jgi:hypothetical protein